MRNVSRAAFAALGLAGLVIAASSQAQSTSAAPTNTPGATTTPQRSASFGGANTQVPDANASNATRQTPAPSSPQGTTSASGTAQTTPATQQRAGTTDADPSARPNTTSGTNQAAGNTPAGGSGRANSTTAAAQTTNPAPPGPAVPDVAGWASLEELTVDPAIARITDWIAASHDNGTMPYMVIDKKSASVLVFDNKGKLLGVSPVLIGIASGDESSPGVGGKELAEIGPAEKTTPAGRFVAHYGDAAGGKKVLWVDWSVSVALHAVVTGNRRERRLERLLSPSPDDNRITFGCINVPTNFYNEKIVPNFERRGGVVYVLPDTKSLESVFPRIATLADAGGSAALARSAQ